MFFSMKLWRLIYVCTDDTDLQALPGNHKSIKFDLTVKLILIGNSGVGKTTLITKLKDNLFDKYSHFLPPTDLYIRNCKTN